MKNTNKIFIIGNSDEDSDWIKRVDGGKFQRQELKVYEDLRKKYTKQDKNKKDE
jgi:hypothetical protein